VIAHRRHTLGGGSAEGAEHPLVRALVAQDDGVDERLCVGSGDVLIEDARPVRPGDFDDRVGER
jgi:hypothetical protein